MFTFPRGGLALAALDEQLLHPGVKGLPITEALRQGAIGVQGWNVLRADTSFPVAVLKTSALRHNLDWMRAFCARYGITLAPHGKTTMCPQLFGAQLANGAWGMTLATATQVQLAHRFGVRRVLLANQLVARADIDSVLRLMHDDPDFECFALADSLAGVQRLAAAVAAQPTARPLPLLVEMGIAGKRAGCRSLDDAMAVARATDAAPGLQLAGIEGYEGLLVSHDRGADVLAVGAFVARLLTLLRQADSEGLFGGSQILLSAGGSAYFDLVARGFAGVTDASLPVKAILRSGCYLTSDHGSYHRLLAELGEREAAAASQQPAADHGPDHRQQGELDENEAATTALQPASDHGADRNQPGELDESEAAPTGPQPASDHSSEHRQPGEGDERQAAATGLQPALEVWSMVQSRPEPTLAILTMGKRDASYDVELPIAFAWHRPGPGAPAQLPAGCRIVKMNDQHAYLQLPAGHAICDELAVGDLVGSGISHPCTTFDKWQLLLAVDDNYNVGYGVNTFF